MSRDPQTDPDELPAKGSFLAGAQAVHPLSDGPRADDLPATSERYWRSFDNSELFPPEGAPSVPSPVSPEAFQALALQVRALTGMVQTIIPLIPRPLHPSATQPLRQREPPAWAHMTLPDPPTSPRRDPESTSARLARPSCAPRLHVARDHACAASPPAPCSSAACCPRPHLRGLPACVVFLGSMAFETHLRSLPACVVLLDPMTRDTPARPARLRRAPRLHGLRDTPARLARLRRAPRPHDPRHTCAASPPASCSSTP
ncbi:hypothetical protein C4D60_Mb06t24060 [Musa balbisiana]|uniref:Uncharacterized protein n=1 Tax=Musa balbisiana TaxID=52838 RepID=A0A4S8IQA3_MUSBA|nr:hypothetical protein C4D60_Mb06t24060 [Musa balbisiana]